MSQNALQKFKQRKWTPPHQVQTIPAPPESREQLLIDIGIAAIVAAVPLAAFLLMVL